MHLGGPGAFSGSPSDSLWPPSGITGPPRATPGPPRKAFGAVLFPGPFLGSVLEMSRVAGAGGSGARAGGRIPPVDPWLGFIGGYLIRLRQSYGLARRIYDACGDNRPRAFGVLLK